MKPHFALRQDKIRFVAGLIRLGHTRPDFIAAYLFKAGYYSPATKRADIESGVARLIKAATEEIQGEKDPHISPQNKTAQPPCSHENWAVRSYDRLGFARCLDCHQEIPLSDLFTRLADKAREIISPHRPQLGFTTGAGLSGVTVEAKG